MAITREQFESSYDFRFEHQENYVSHFSSEIIIDGFLGIINIQLRNGEMIDQLLVTSIHQNYAITKFIKFGKKYTYRLYFFNCELL